MTRRHLEAFLIAGLVLLAGCTGGVPSQSAPQTSDVSPTDTAATGGTDGAASTGTVAFYISDEENAIGDFVHLNVTVTRVGFERAEGDWVERDVDNRTVDLTRLQGKNATLVDAYELENGTYTKVFLHVSEVNGTLANGTSQRVKLPSGKVQLTKGFTVENWSDANFVFDITVKKAGKSGKYVLTPVVGESGTDVPVESVDAEADEDEADSAETDEDDADETADATRDATLNASFLGTVTRGENATVAVTRSGNAVENATVAVNGETVGTTGADGELAFTVPDADELTVHVTLGDAEVELEREFEGDGGT